MFSNLHVEINYTFGFSYRSNFQEIQSFFIQFYRRDFIRYSNHARATKSNFYLRFAHERFERLHSGHVANSCCAKIIVECTSKWRSILNMYYAHFLNIYNFRFTYFDNTHQVKPRECEQSNCKFYWKYSYRPLSYFQESSKVGISSCW